MTIREELLKAGFSDEYVDKESKIIYDRYLNDKSRKKFTDTKIGKFLCMDWCDYLVHKAALYYYEKEKRKNRKLPEFTGNKNNPIDIYEYNAWNGIMPIETIDNKDGSYTHKYEDGTIVTIKVTITSFLHEDLTEKVKIRNRRLLADYLYMNEEEVINMSEDEIESLVNKNEFNKKIKKVLRLDKNKI